MQLPNRSQHIRQLTAELAVTLVVESFQVDLIQLNVWAQVFEDALGGVAVGHICADQPDIPGRSQHLQRPLTGDQRFVVRRGDHRRPVTLGRFHDFLRRQLVHLRDGARIAQGLTGHPVLAVPAVQIAPEHAEAQRVAPRECVEERLLLDRIARQRADVTGRHLQHAPIVEPDAADAGSALRNLAFVPARIAQQATVRQSLVQLALGRHLLQHLLQCNCLLCRRDHACTSTRI